MDTTTQLVLAAIAVICLSETVHGQGYQVPPGQPQNPTLSPPNAQTCGAVQPDKRNDCGIPGMQKPACVAKNCCWDDTKPGVRFCFYPMGNDQTVDCSAKEVPIEARLDCGWPGMDADDCHSMGCCWDQQHPGGHFCFLPSPDQGKCKKNNPNYGPCHTIREKKVKWCYENNWITKGKNGKLKDPYKQGAGCRASAHDLFQYCCEIGPNQVPKKSYDKAYGGK